MLLLVLFPGQQHPDVLHGRGAQAVVQIHEMWTVVAPQDVAGVAIAVNIQQGKSGVCQAFLNAFQQLPHRVPVLAAVVEIHHVIFPWEQQGLIEPLRIRRMIGYDAWLAKRWDDPAFPPAFPWFESMHYWGNQITLLQQQLRELDRQA